LRQIGPSLAESGTEIRRVREKKSGLSSDELLAELWAKCRPELHVIVTQASTWETEETLDSHLHKLLVTARDYDDKPGVAPKATILNSLSKITFVGIASHRLQMDDPQ